MELNEEKLESDLKAEQDAFVLETFTHVQALIKKFGQVHEDFITSEIEGYTHNQKILMALRALNFLSSHASSTFHNRLREMELEGCEDFKR